MNSNVRQRMMANEGFASAGPGQMWKELAGTARQAAAIIKETDRAF